MGMKNYQKSKITPKFSTKEQMKIMDKGQENVKSSQSKNPKKSRLWHMATSGTTSFNLDIDDIIEDAYERCGVRTNSGYNIKSARRSLNILFLNGEIEVFTYGK